MFLLRTEPLYQTAIVSSAYRHRMTLFAKISHPSRVATLVQQEMHVETYIKLVRHFAQNSYPYKGICITTVVIRLLFCEVISYPQNLQALYSQLLYSYLPAMIMHNYLA